jgi:D-alanyl-lipoteichoic acid acyltransferase DltB (MBOAT superfamily)
MDGLRIMLWGLFKKLVVADRLAAIVDAIYAHPNQTGGAYLILATWLFAVQIYCDFSGYSDMAIGAARVLGIELVRNFDRPYASQSVAEFWRRWHISLSSWFRDYLYIPLGGNRVALPRWCFNVMIVFLLSGLWHGANWTFAIWGALHGMYVIASRLSERARQRVASELAINRTAPLCQAWRVFVTFNLVSFAWIFFRAPTLPDAGAVLRRMFGRHFWTPPNLATGPVGFSAYTAAELNISLATVALLFAVEWIQSRSSRASAARFPIWARWSAYYGTVVLILWFGAFGGRTFIYFQF